MEEIVRNRKGLKIVLDVENLPGKGPGEKKPSVNKLDAAEQPLVFITHGYSGARQQPHIIGMREAFADSGFTVVSYDMTHAFGDSDGDLINATASTYIEDLTDIIEWARSQSWYREPFFLAGHSLGSLASLIFASRNPELVSGIFPMSTVVSGELWHATQDPTLMARWQRDGYFYKESATLPGKNGKAGWAVAEDMWNYDVLKVADRLTMPVLLMVGADDDGTTPAAHILLLEKLLGPKRLELIEGMPHTPETADQIDEMKAKLKQWLAGLR